MGQIQRESCNFIQTVKVDVYAYMYQNTDMHTSMLQHGTYIANM